MNKTPLKCEICGKFIKYSDIPVLINVQFIPDTEYTIEKTEFTHKKCLDKIIKNGYKI